MNLPNCYMIICTGWFTQKNGLKIYSVQSGERWILLSAVPESVESKLRAVKESIESCWVLSGRALSPAELCPGERWVLVSAVRESVESKLTQSGRALSHNSFVNVFIFFLIISLLINHRHTLLTKVGPCAVFRAVPLSRCIRMDIQYMCKIKP